MTQLWPHLPAVVAAVEYDKLRDGAIPMPRETHPDRMWAPIGNRVPEKQVRELIDLVSKVAENYGFPAIANPSARVMFDREVSSHIQRQMKLSWAEAGNRDVWSFLALVALPHLTSWRFGLNNRERWVATDLTRHAWSRLWWQAVVFEGHDHLLSALSESDLNQLLERRSIGGDPRLARELARSVVEVSVDIPRRAVIRDVTLRLRRYLAFVDVRALEDQQVRRLCATLTAETVARLSD